MDVNFGLERPMFSAASPEEFLKSNLEEKCLKFGNF
jgi:hypothetical protein